MWFDSGILILLMAKSSKPAVRNNNLADNEQKSSFLVYETDLFRTVLCSAIEMMLQAIRMSFVRLLCPFSLIIMGWFVSSVCLFLTVHTFTHIHPGAKPTQSARGSPQGRFEWISVFLLIYSNIPLYCIKRYRNKGDLTIQTYAIYRKACFCH